MIDRDKALANLAHISKLVAEAASTGELAGLRTSGSEHLADARNEQLALSSRFDLAYNAAHAFSLAALRWHGYRSDSRYLVFQDPAAYSRYATQGLASAGQGTRGTQCFGILGLFRGGCDVGE